MVWKLIFDGWVGVGWDKNVLEKEYVGEVMGRRFLVFIVCLFKLFFINKSYLGFFFFVVEFFRFIVFLFL